MEWCRTTYHSWFILVAHSAASVRLLFRPLCFESSHATHEICRLQKAVMLSCLFCVLQGWWQVCTAMPLELSKNIFSLTMRLRFFPHGATATRGPGLPYYPGFTITLKTHPLDRTTEDLYLTPHNTQESDIHAPDRIRSHTPITRLQTHAIERAATGIDEWPSYLMKIWSQVTAMYRSIGSPVSKVMWEATC